ncbi:hypothetical protein PG994_007705 [Apiospora phragmitis]|uniref:Uncharacterized protein n=1 Tax=Apiospora phragmitis TaxID=2905665 RepID=A0ABR1UU35_9PEZI
MTTFASNGNFATSAMNIAFSLSCTSASKNPLFHHGIENFSLARPSYYQNPLFTEDSDDDGFDLEFRDDFTIISNKDEPLDPVDSLTRSLSSCHITSTLPSDSESTSSTQSLRSTGSNNSSKATPKSILKKPKGSNDHTKPKKAVVWHTELAHDIINGEHVPQTQLPREEWYAHEIMKQHAAAMADANWFDVSADM